MQQTKNSQETKKQENQRKFQVKKVKIEQTN